MGWQKIRHEFKGVAVLEEVDRVVGIQVILCGGGFLQYPL